MSFCALTLAVLRVRKLLNHQRLFMDYDTNYVTLSTLRSLDTGEIIEKGKNGRLTPVVKPLEALLGKPVTKVNDCMGPEVEAAASKLKGGEVLLLENTRFYKGETKNDPELSAGLGKLADYFVMDAFGTAHRAHSSTAGVAEHMKYSAAGYLMEKELKFLVGAVENPKRP